jgi:transposase-like protein
VARDLGIQRDALRLWVRQAEADAGERHDLLTTNERERLTRLEREVREVRKAPLRLPSGRRCPWSTSLDTRASFAR